MQTWLVFAQTFTYEIDTIETNQLFLTLVLCGQSVEGRYEQQKPWVLNLWVNQQGEPIS